MLAVNMTQSIDMIALQEDALVYVVIGLVGLLGIALIVSQIVDTTPSIDVPVPEGYILLLDCFERLIARKPRASLA
jgi:hypothetical protein